MEFTRDSQGHYTFQSPLTEEVILAAAEEILERKLHRLGSLGNPRDTETFLKARMAHLEHEEFHLVYLDNRHRILGTECITKGTIDGAMVHPREVIKAVLRANAAAVIFAHNHPSQDPEPSAADRAITKTLVDALALVEVRVLDHLVVSAGKCVSLAERGLM